MCQFSTEANEQMEPTDDIEELVDSSASDRVNLEQGTANQDGLSTREAPASLIRPANSLTSIDSFASKFSNLSVDVNTNDGHKSEENEFESWQGDLGDELLAGYLSKSSSMTSVNANEQSNYLNASHKEENNGFVLGNLDQRSISCKCAYESDDNSSNDDEAIELSRANDDNNEIWAPPQAANEDNNTDHSLFALDDDDECADTDGTEWVNPSSLNGDENVSDCYRFKEEKKKAMEEVMNGKFKDLVSQLLNKLGLDNFGEREKIWIDTVTLLAWQAALYIKPDATEAKAMDPSGYVKIKCIETGSPTESRLVKGLVFKKHAAHKHMATKYKNPRLLLIRGMLDQSSDTSGLFSFSSMIPQAEGNLAALLKNLKESHANIILVEKSAARDVVEGVLKLGVTLVLDMKDNRLQRVARCTGSPIVSFDKPFNEKLTHCDSVYFEKLVEDHAIVGEGGKKPSKTLMFLEGCPKRLGCTILLKGSHRQELKKIKTVVQCAFVMAYNFILETYFLVDQKAMFSTFSFNTEDVSSTNEQSTSVVVEPSNTHSDDHISNGVGPMSNDDDDDNDEGDDDDDNDDDYEDDDDGSSHMQESTTNAASSPVIDIPISYGTHVEESIFNERAAKSCGITTSAVSPATFQQISTYVDLNERELEVETATSIPISSFEERDQSNVGFKGSIQDNPLHNQSLHLSEDETKAVDDVEDWLRPMDDISSMLYSESILVLISKRNASEGTVCQESRFSRIEFYKNFDEPLWKFLRDYLFSQSQRCKDCKALPESHLHYYAHHRKQLTIRIKRVDIEKELPGESEGKIWMWSRCGKCDPRKMAETKRGLLSTAAHGLSFGKFLELSISSRSSFNRLSSCGHSLQKDFLYFFGSGSMVAMFQYSRVARYKVSVPAHKLEFNSSLNKDCLQPEIRSVYTEGLMLFNEVSDFLKKIESKYSGLNLVLNGTSKGFSDIVTLVKLERSEFEESIKSIGTDNENIGTKNENIDDSARKILRLNQLRLEILLEARVWNRRLQVLLSLSSALSHTTSLKEDMNSGGRAEVHDMVEGTGEQTGLENNSVVDSGQQEAAIHCVESISQGNQSTSESCSDGEVQVERVTGGEGDSVTDLPIVEETVSRVSSLQESLESSNLLSELHLDGESPQIDDILVSGNVSEENSERLASTPSSNSEDSEGWIWHPLAQIQEKYRMELLNDTAIDLLPALSQVVNRESSRLHILVNDGKYIVSDYEGEISSSIACALAMLSNNPLPSDSSGNTFLNRTESEPSTNLSLKSYDSETFRSAPSMPSTRSPFSSFDGLNWLESMTEDGQTDPEVTLGRDRYFLKGKYSVVVIYADKFRALRERCCQSELEYIASISRCKIWDAKGGKSKSFFAKTLDERHIIKEIQKVELVSFLEFGPSYFTHLNESFKLGNQTCLAKVLGIYQVTIRNAKSGRETKHDLMIQENLSFGRNISRQYDLKGTTHARLRPTTDVSGDVLLDQNFVNDMNSSPMYISLKAKRILQRAVWNDTTFLHSSNVMDYSLLVSVDRERKELVCGIIDYLRKYSWDKKLETWVKVTLVVPKNTRPTIVSPREYKGRFRVFMDKRFLTVPDHWCSERASKGP